MLLLLLLLLLLLVLPDTFVPVLKYYDDYMYISVRSCLYKLQLRLVGCLFVYFCCFVYFLCFISSFSMRFDFNVMAFRHLMKSIKYDTLPHKIDKHTNTIHRLFFSPILKCFTHNCKNKVYITALCVSV